MGILSIFTGGMSTVYKWAAIGGAILAIAVTAFFYGEHMQAGVDASKQLKQTVKQEQQTITITKIQTVVDTSAVDALQKKLDGEKQLNAILQQKLTDINSKNLTVVTGEGANATCKLSKDWVDIYNGSLQ